MKFYLEKASYKHCKLLFDWVNDNDVRKNSFNQRKIDYIEHKKWFNNKLRSKECFIFICYNFESIPIGQVRADIECKNAIISYSIDKLYRGKGIGKLMLQLLEDKILEEKVDVDNLIAYVRAENVISQKVFKKLGYTESNDNNNVIYYKNISRKIYDKNKALF